MYRQVKNITGTLIPIDTGRVTDNCNQLIKTELLKLIPKIKDNNAVTKNSTKEKHTDGKLLLDLSKIYNYFLKSEKNKHFLTIV